MRAWTLEACWAGCGLFAVGLAAGLVLAAVVGVAVLLFGVTQGRAVK